MSYVPGNNEMFFGQSKTCELLVPNDWDDYIRSNSTLLSSTDLLTMDLDGDGASNIIEYYGLLPLISLYSDGSSTASSNDAFQRQGTAHSTNPLDPDTDNDLFIDSYELLYGLDPFTPNNVSDDTDGDGLTDLDEQIYGTNTLNADSDGDGVDDATELLSDKTDPLDDTDLISIDGRQLQDSDCTNQSKIVSLTLLVGDPSGSNSERYILNVGRISHQATDFGVLRTSTYNFQPGTYEITVQHLDSNRATPDYDYKAAISWTESPDFEIAIDDPQGILGSHSESNYDYAAGKSATLTIKQLNVKCSYSTCTECREDFECRWDVDTKKCSQDCRKRLVRLPPSSCPCEKCKAWAKEERKDLTWIAKLPQCPCTVKTVTVGVSAGFGSNEILSATVDFLSVPNAQGVDWDNDLNCNPNTDCSTYHPGAHGCLRADGPKGSSSGQQCCYTEQGAHIATGKGAGTLDKEAGGLFNWYDHVKADVDTYKTCCQECEIPDVCLEYIGGTDSNGNNVVGVRQDSRPCRKN